MKGKKCGIYKITNIVNNKNYIGQSKDIYRRWGKYRWALDHGGYINPHLQSAWNKYGKDNFKFEIILECQEEKLNEEEIRLIKEYKSNDRKYGYNIEAGGKYTTVFSRRIKLSLSERQRSVRKIICMANALPKRH